MGAPLIPIGESRLLLTRRQQRALAAERLDGLMRVTEVRIHADVQAEKLRSVDYLARQAMGGQAMLHQWTAGLAQGDPLLADELRFFSDLARVGKGEVIADAIRGYSRGR
jgi:hypothetical protein